MSFKVIAAGISFIVSERNRDGKVCNQITTKPIIKFEVDFSKTNLNELAKELINSLKDKYPELDVKETS